jgi:hypothetical protein
MGDVTNAFWESVFSLCRAPLTTNLIVIFTTWQHYEGGSARFNPLNTTRPANGSTPYNSAGVQQYASEASGASATALTLLNGRYPSIVAAMRADTPMDSWSIAPIPDEVDTWGTHGFATHLRTLTPPPPPPTPTEETTVWLYQAANGTIYLVSGGTRLAFTNIADVQRYQSEGVKLYTAAQFTPEWNAQLQKYPAL